MNVEYFISKRIVSAKENKNVFSRPIIRLTIFAIALSVAIMLISLSILDGFQSEVTNKVISFGSHIQIESKNKDNSYKKNPILADEDLLYLIRKGNEIENIEKVIYNFGLIKTKDDFLGIEIKGVEDGYNFDFFQERLIKGEILNSNDCSGVRSNEWCASILISSKIASKLKVDIGEKLKIYFPSSFKTPRPFIISGIYNAFMEGIDDNFAIVNINKLRKVNAKSDSIWNNSQNVERLEITLSDFTKVDKVKESLQSSLDSVSILMKDPYNKNIVSIKDLYPEIFDWLNLMNVNVVVIIILILIVAVVNITTSLLILILEKTKFIGILKSLGASNWSIRKMFIYNAMYLVSKGLLWGNVIAFLLLFIQYHFQIISLDPETYYMETVPISFDILSFLLLNVGILIVCFVMMIFPTIVITKISAVKAIRFE